MMYWILMGCALLKPFPANTQRCFSVDICWHKIVTSVHVIPMLSQRHIVNTDSTMKSTLKQRWIWVYTKGNFVDKLQCWWNYDSHKKYKPISTLKQRRKTYVGPILIFNRILILKQRWWTLTVNLVSKFISRWYVYWVAFTYFCLSLSKNTIESR